LRSIYTLFPYTTLFRSMQRGTKGNFKSWCFFADIPKHLKHMHIPINNRVRISIRSYRGQGIDTNIASHLCKLGQIKEHHVLHSLDRKSTRLNPVTSLSR